MLWLAMFINDNLGLLHSFFFHTLVLYITYLIDFLKKKIIPTGEQFYLLCFIYLSILHFSLISSAFYGHLGPTGR